MGINEGGMMTMRASVLRLIEQLEAALDQLTPCEIAGQVDRIRQLSKEANMLALADMAHGVETILAWGPGQPVLQPWISALKEAAGCEALDENAVQSWLAALGMRHAH